MNMQIIDDITRFIFIENELEPADAVLIPGGSLAELPQEAAKCWKENLAPIVVPSGKYSIKTDFFHGARSQQDKYPGAYDTEADSARILALIMKAIDGIRTRGLHLGKVALYQLSYYRILSVAYRDNKMNFKP